MNLPNRSACAVVALAAFAGLAFAQAPAPGRVRGTVVSSTGDVLIVHRTNADDVTIDFKSDVPVLAVKNVALADLKPGSFVGATSVPGPDGKRIAREVHVFAESARGTGEGHREWDLPNSTMTNATVDIAVQSTSGRELKVSYKDGTQTIVVPEGTPVVTYAEAARADVVAGRKVFITARSTGPGRYTALRIVVEKDGVAPPM